MFNGKIMVQQIFQHFKHQNITAEPINKHYSVYAYYLAMQLIFTVNITRAHTHTYSFAQNYKSSLWNAAAARQKTNFNTN